LTELITYLIAVLSAQEKKQK